MLKDVKKFAVELYEDLCWEGMEFFIHQDGKDLISGVRQTGSMTGDYDSDIILTIPLDEWFWRDTLANFDIYDIKNVDEVTKKAFVDYLQEFIEEEFGK